MRYCFPGVLVLLCMLTFSGRCEADASAPSLRGAKVLKGLRRTHPRLMLLDADLAKIRKAIEEDDRAAGWYRHLLRRAKQLLREPTVTYELRGPRLLHVSRRALDRIYTLGLAYRLTGERRFAERAIEELLAVCSFKDWHPPHFLDTAEMTHAVAIGYDWLYHVLTPEQRRRVRDAIVGKGLRPAWYCYRKGRWWTRTRFNWNQVCNGGTAIGALAVADEEPDLCAYLLAEAVQRIRLAMRQYAPDGGWAEGPGYWHYATMYTVYMLAALESALGTDFGLSEIPGFSEAGMFRIYIVGPTGLTFNFADAHERAGSAPEMFWLARRFRRPVYAWHEVRYAGRGSPFDLLWFEPSFGRAERGNLPLDAYFRGVEVVFLRSAWEDPKAIFVGFKAGDNRANHSHLDLGTFVLDALGKRWAVDLGSDNYNLPGYFGRKRFTYYRLRTEGHNTLVLNGENQNPDAKAKIIAFKSTEGEAFAVADLSEAYRSHAAKVWRGVGLVNGRRSVLIQDEIETAGVVDIVWSMHTRASVQVSGRRATLTEGAVHLLAEILEPEDAEFTVASAKAPAPQNPNKGVRKLLIRLPSVTGRVRVVVLLKPYVSGPSDFRPVVRPLSAWKGSGTAGAEAF